MAWRIGRPAGRAVPLDQSKKETAARHFPRIATRRAPGSLRPTPNAAAVAGALALLLLLASSHSPAARSEWLEESRGTQGVSPSSPFTSQLFFPMVFRNYVSPLWRFGADRVLRPLAAYDAALPLLRLGWYFDFGADLAGAQPYPLDYIPVVRLKQVKYDEQFKPTLCRLGPYYLHPAQYSASPSLATITALAKSYPGRTWTIGNEMDRIDWGAATWCMGQDEMLPEEYALAYHDVYWTIKRADPTAQVAIGALVQFTPLRQQYLDRVWAEYQRLYSTPMPVDVWNMHVYVFNEKSCTAFPSDCWGAEIPPGFTVTSGTSYQYADNRDFNQAIPMIVAMRTWMKDHGQQAKPLITNEYGALLPDWVFGSATPPSIRDRFMYPSFDYLLNAKDTSIGMPSDGYRLVQRWAWWSLDSDDGEYYNGTWFDHNAGYLFHSGLNPNGNPRPEGLTSAGSDFQKYVRNVPVALAGPYPKSALPAVVNGDPDPAAPGGHWVDWGECAKDANVRAQLMQPPGPTLSEAERRRRISEISKLTGGTRICLQP